MAPPLAGMSRRRFLGRAVMASLSLAAAGSLLEACARGRLPQPPSPLPTAPVVVDELPHVFPEPLEASYGELTEIHDLVCRSCPSARLAGLLDEVAASVGLSVVADDRAGPNTGRLDISTGVDDLAAQGYRLEVTSSGAGDTLRLNITIACADEAGAYYGLLSLAQLISVGGASHMIRAATVRDGPAFARRGVILDMPLPVTTAGRDALLERVRLGARFKMNLLWPANAALDDRPTARALVDYCDAHYIELLNCLGYQERLTETPRRVLTDQIRSYYDQGMRSFSFNWDDSNNLDADAHGVVLDDLVRYVATLGNDVRLRVTLPPYGGVPGINLMFGSGGETYLASMSGHIPVGAEVFWTGDGGIWSTTVTAQGARAYGDAVGHSVAFWDNSIAAPLKGRAADLAAATQTYMGNMAGPGWQTSGGAGRALLTALDYTWNPLAYDPNRAAAEADLWLAQG